MTLIYLLFITFIAITSTRKKLRNKHHAEFNDLSETQEQGSVQMYETCSVCKRSKCYVTNFVQNKLTDVNMLRK